MALNFPNTPYDGQVYPDPPIPGTQQYVWNAEKGTWLTVFKGIERLSAQNPLYTAGSEQAPIIGIFPASETEAGYLSAADKKKLNDLPEAVGSVSAVTAGVGLGAPQTGGVISTVGTLDLLPATSAVIGGVRPGIGVATDSAGTINVQPPSGPAIGGVKQGTGLSISADGTIGIKPGGTFYVIDPISRFFDSVAVTFPLQVNGNPFSPSTPQSMLIFMGGVFQVPNISYTTSPGSITFTEAPPADLSFYGISLT